MEQVNNYLKKGALILVVVMLLVIPSLHVYSSIGSHQIVSSAITANKNHQILNIADHWFKNNKLLSEADCSYLLAIGLIQDETMRQAAIWSAVNLLGCVLKAQETQGHSLASKYVAKNYTKYDFSGFDN